MLEDNNRTQRPGRHLLIAVVQVLLSFLVYVVLQGLVVAQEEKTPASPPPTKKTKTTHGPLSPDQGATSMRKNRTASHGNATAGRGATAGHGAAAGHGNAAASRGNFHQPAGTRNVSLRGGGRANVRANGSIRSVDRNGMHIDRGLHGGRTVVSVHNNVRVVSYGHGGYVQHAYFSRGGRSFYSRTFVVGGVVHVGVYRGYFWGGRNYYGFYPGFWYHPGFYGWGFQPWGVPVAWGIGAWGWGGPWWGYYGGWWNPYPVYAAPYFWLTDYLIAANLQAAYAARPEESADAGVADAGSTDTAAAPASTAVTLTPEVKQAIAEEVKAQLAAQQAQAQAGGATAAPASASASAAPPALDPANRTFVVDTAVTAVANGTECGLTSGDVVTRLTDTPDATDNTVNASVSATKKGDCASGATVAIKVDDLQEMYNHFQEQLTSGMGELAKKQGTNGMPKAPDTGTTASDVPAPKPDPDAEKILKDQQQQADETEKQVKEELSAASGALGDK
jgi:hypothetical protein